MQEEVKFYYGKALQTSADLQTNACCTGDAMPDHVRDAIELLAPAVVERYFGCGLVVPAALEGLRVLDLGCGAGRDAFLLSYLVGEQGAVVGVDMTREQLDVARAHVDEHAQRFGYAASNVTFVEGELERLDQLGLPAEGFDLIVSNCVINLCPDKAQVLRQAHRLLKPGGEMYFSDVYADRRVPPAVVEHPVLYNECLGGALYWNDLIHVAKEAGFADPRLVSDSRITIDNPELAMLAGDLGFYSATYRLFRLEQLEPACEDYGQAVVYRGSLAEQPTRFVLDKQHAFDKGRVVPVCGNTFDMLHESRFRRHFEFIGDKSTHFGIFAGCGSVIPFDAGDPADSAAPGAGCC